MRKLQLDELNRPSIEEFRQQSKVPMIVLADNIRSGLNVGSLFRSSDAFAIEEIILCGISAQPPHKEINKTAIGATEAVSWRYIQDAPTAISELKQKGYTIYGVEQTSESLELNRISLSAGNKVVLIMGNEVDGISNDVLPLLDHAVEIPQFGTKHSLNVAVCAGIVMHYFACQLREL